MNILFYLLACGDKCPEGFAVDEVDQSCYCPSGTELSADSTSCTSLETTDTDTTAADSGIDTDTDTDTGGDTEIPVDPWEDYEEINGKIIIPTLFEGRLIPRAVFHHEVDGKLLIYMSANGSADCDTVSGHLGAGTVRPDPSSLFIQNHCNMRITLQDATLLSTADFFAECSYGVGSFAAAGDSWEWTGTDDDGVDAEYFQAIGLNGNATALDVGGSNNSEINDSEIAIEISITQWAGSFPYSDNYTTSDAVGTGFGFIISEPCPALANTPILSEPPE